MSNTLQTAVKSILAGTVLSLASTGAFAAGGVSAGVAVTNWTGSDNIVGANETITTVSKSFGSNNSWTDNPLLDNSAWGHAVTWFTFQVTSPGQTVILKDTITSGSRASAFTVYASNGLFNGGSLYGDETNNGTSWSNAPHSFNPVGQVGSPGTLWAADPSVSKLNPSIDPLVTVGGGNLLKTLAYVNAGIAHTDPTLNDWNETINAGANQVDFGGTYFAGVTGSTGADFAQLVFNNLASGYYTVAVGGANSASSIATANHQFSVAAVPVPGAVYLFGSALAGLLASTRRKSKLA